MAAGADLIVGRSKYIDLYSNRVNVEGFYQDCHLTGFFSLLTGRIESEEMEEAMVLGLKTQILFQFWVSTNLQLAIIIFYIKNDLAFEKMQAGSMNGLVDKKDIQTGM